MSDAPSITSIGPRSTLGTTVPRRADESGRHGRRRCRRCARAGSAARAAGSPPSWRRSRSATPEQKKTLGSGANELKKHVEAALAEREAELAATRRPAGAVDITLPGRGPRLGYRHPLSLIREEVSDIFSRLGYQVLEGPEIEDDYHNFEALNMPAEHPARDMQDTLYLAEPLMPASTSRRRAASRRARRSR